MTHDKYDDWFPSDKELDNLLPITEVDPELLAAQKSGELKRRGRPSKDNKKVPMSIRVDPEVLSALKDTGKGWQTRVNNVLKQWVDEHPQ